MNTTSGDNTTSMPTPFLSVIIPTYNRATLISRAIRSVLDYADDDVEILVVDGASTDGTQDRVREIGDARVHLIPSRPNDGQCAARNLGAREARGEWLVFLDSDDELAPQALGMIRQRAKSAASTTGKLMFSCRGDSGIVSPDPPLEDRVVDYVGYLHWADSTYDRRSEGLPCARRTAFLTAPYPEAYGWPEGIHELNFVRQYDLQFCPEVVRLYHSDADVRGMAPSVENMRRRARGFADHAETVLETHGDALKKHAPRRWELMAREAALYNFFAGDRSKGVRNSFVVLGHSPVNTMAWTVLLGGVFAPNAMLRYWSIRRAKLAY